MITTLMKRDFYINAIYFLIIALAIPALYIIEMAEFYLYFGIMMGFLFNLFYYDHRNNVNRFIGSLPVKLQHVVLSRYVLLLVVVVGFLLYTWLVDSLAHNGLPYIESKTMSSIEITILFTLISIAISISIPIYYFVKSITTALAIQGGLLIFGTFTFAILTGNELITFHDSLLLWFFDLIEIQPIVMLIIISLVFLYLSYLLSARIYIKKAKV
ncbi:ABC-2 transporter permease [Oceanobacillus picturae]|uniref:ABC-2 transporter permease n=1 Tax=Oceanobacillus picturae TaxID=171693 RepID=UPI00073D330F|nr:ABC-2 transporter permease [Oceanobacillus picturae]